MAEECVITGEVLEIVCDDNGTPDNMDDTYSVTISASGNGDNGFILRNVTDGGSAVIGGGADFNVAYTFGPYPIFIGGVQQMDAVFQVEGR